MLFDKIGLALLGLALISNIIGVAIPYWFYFSLTVQGETGSANFGLWKSCGSETTGKGGTFVTKCMNFDNTDGFTVPTAFYAARALEILAILATTAAIIVVCMKIFFKKENNRLLYIAAPISIFASLFVIIGAIVFVVDNEVKKMVESANPLVHFKPHASFGLSIVAGILNIVASPMLILAARAIPGLT
ncbi:claudin-1-like isoform X2 [Ruditapes philippinarum]|uniref:claudin-1-like isoform X2 n=1 Tax=Ruditapes philippinarum TaxID=129788 RepID=UPI00295ACAFB|nr:claudin-1-like isoform X2 [Ruditapes philippinarum]